MANRNTRQTPPRLDDKELDGVTGGIELENTLISSYSVSGSAGDAAEPKPDTRGFSWGATRTGTS